MLSAALGDCWSGGGICEGLDEASDIEDGDPLVLSQQMVEDVLCQMALARSEVCTDNSGRFGVNPLGGTWTSREKQVAQDAWQGKPCTAQAKQWCNDFGIAQLQVGLVPLWL